MSKRILIGLVLAALVVGALQSTPITLFAAARTVDGDPSDWTGTPSALPHHDASSDTEWIYTGVAGDRRTDSGMTDDNDITEVRLTTDGTYLFFLIRMADISDASKVHIAIGIDTNQESNPASAGQNFLGDQSGLTYATRPFIRPERQLALRFGGSGSPVIEWFAGGTWYGIGGSQIAISAANNIVEARVPLNDLNSMNANSSFILTMATFTNAPGWNNDNDTTATGAVDSLGIPGQGTANAWDRDLSDGAVSLGWYIKLNGAANAPTAVVFDRLYHSSCDQFTTFGCPAGDHPQVEQIPSFQSFPNGEPPRFMNARRFSNTQVIPGRSTNVFIYDDEPMEIYMLAMAGDLTVDSTTPFILYYGSGGTVTISQVGTWTGSWKGAPPLTYAIFQGFIPSQPPGDVYYSMNVRDFSGDRALCRTTGGLNTRKTRNLFGQAFSADGCAFADFAYSVMDDDTSGPSIANLTFTDNGSNDQICADVVDNVSESGDNDSGVHSVTLRYASTKAAVIGGGGTTASMTLTTGNTYCATGLDFTDPTYYRVEALNNDFDNGIPADRDFSKTSELCEGASCDNSYDGDNNVRWFEVLHDTRNRTAIPVSGKEKYRDPFGAVQTGSAITLRIRTAHNDLEAASVKVYNTTIGDQVIVGNKLTESNPDYDWYEFVITPAMTATARELYYKFILIDGTDVDWYIDDYSHNSYDHEDRYENGTGMVVDDGEAPQYFGNAFRITVYDAAFASSVAAWAPNAVIYQIMPDRFRNADPANDNAAPYSDVYGNPATLSSTWNAAPEDARVTNQWSRDFFGGDLKGIRDELDYLKRIGVTAIYLNPVFAAPSNHGYDTTDYYKINPRYGTNADFQQLAAEADARGIKIILDGVFNHTGSDSVYFDRYNRWDVNGNPVTGNDGSGACESASSPYAAFYTFTPLAGGPCRSGTATYDSWWGYDTLPLAIDGVPNNAWRNFVFDVNNDGTNGINSLPAIIQYWYQLGAGGWRFDVADEIPHDFWQQFRAQVKGNDGYLGPLYTEVWYEATPWLFGDQLDATMNYRFRKAVLGFLIDSTWTDNDNNGDQTMWKLSPSEFDYVLNSIREDYPPIAWYAMMNLMGSHDTNRPGFVLRERSVDAPTTIAKMKLMAAIQFTMPGAPTIYYGDEVGLGLRDYGGYANWGAGKTVSGIVQDDPYNRHTFPRTPIADDPYSQVPGAFGGFTSSSGALPGSLPNLSLQETYRRLGLARADYAVLRLGDWVTLLADDTNEIYAYARLDADNTLGGADCAITIINRSTATRSVTLNNLPAQCANLAYTDLLSGTTASAASSLSTSLSGLTARVFLPPQQNPNTVDNTATLPPHSLTLASSHLTLATGATGTLTATLTDLAGVPLPAGVTVNAQVLSGSGTLSASSVTTDSSGTLSVNYTAPSTPEQAIIRLSIASPSGRNVEAHAAVFVGYSGAPQAASGAVRLPIGTKLSQVGAVQAIKRGTGEPVVLLGSYTSDPTPFGAIAVSPFVPVRLSSTSNVDDLIVKLPYTNAPNEADFRAWWYDGSTWRQFVGSSDVDTTNDVYALRLTAASEPALSDVANGVIFMIAAPPTYNASVSSGGTLVLNGLQNVNIGHWLTLSNAGGGILNVSVQTISGPFSVSGLPVSIGQGSPITITVNCTPSPTPQTGVLVLQSNEIGSPTYTYNLICSRALDTIAVYRADTFLIRYANTTGFADLTLALGASGDIPVAGDWDGDGVETIGFYRPSTGQFFLKDSNTPSAPVVYSFSFGAPGDIPVVGDWDNDGKAGVGVFQPSTGRFLLRNALSTGFADHNITFGTASDLPVAGDWDGDGFYSIGVYRPSTGQFFLSNTLCTACIALADYAFFFGTAADIPFIGDWNADGASGVGVFRVSNGNTYFRNVLSTGPADWQIIYGIGGDQPLAAKWLPDSGPDAPSAPEAAPTFVPRQ
ncbi:MAG: alpha-amylase family glycosyl hydrolase [Aggregatilineales bacterium]